LAKKDTELSCSFCGRSKGDVGLLISGIDAHICEDCIHQGNEIVINESGGKVGKRKKLKFELKKPKEIKALLDYFSDRIAKFMS
jgi:ATP-dependent Clp protease ATP-binding subunit ClpX